MNLIDIFCAPLWFLDFCLLANPVHSTPHFRNLTLAGHYGLSCTVWCAAMRSYGTLQRGGDQVCYILGPQPDAGSGFDLREMVCILSKTANSNGWQLVGQRLAVLLEIESSGRLPI